MTSSKRLSDWESGFLIGLFRADSHNTPVCGLNDMFPPELLNSAGVPIYTIAKMLTHRNVKNTQIYAEVMDPNKREAANVISLK